MLLLSLYQITERSQSESHPIPCIMKQVNPNHIPYPVPTCCYGTGRSESHSIIPCTLSVIMEQANPNHIPYPVPTCDYGTAFAVRFLMFCCPLNICVKAEGCYRRERV